MCDANIDFIIPLESHCGIKKQRTILEKIAVTVEANMVIKKGGA